MKEEKLRPEIRKCHGEFLVLLLSDQITGKILMGNKSWEPPTLEREREGEPSVVFVFALLNLLSDAFNLRHQQRTFCICVVVSVLNSW